MKIDNPYSNYEQVCVTYPDGSFSVFGQCDQIDINDAVECRIRPVSHGRSDAASLDNDICWTKEHGLIAEERLRKIRDAEENAREEAERKVREAAERKRVAAEEVKVKATKNKKNTPLSGVRTPRKD